MTIAAIGAIRSLPLISVWKGREADPPMMARVSMTAAGARAVKKELCIMLEDFRRVNEVMFLNIEEIDSAQVLSFLVYIPSFLIFSITIGVFISK
jgi:hypothetical protein